jgi:hypothetical protein
MTQFCTPGCSCIGCLIGRILQRELGNVPQEMILFGLCHLAGRLAAGAVVPGYEAEALADIHQRITFGFSIENDRRAKQQPTVEYVGHG